jgi:hypothetical protein
VFCFVKVCLFFFNDALAPFGSFHVLFGPLLYWV